MAAIVTDLHTKTCGAASTLTRTEVRCGGKNPYPEKNLKKPLQKPNLHRRCPKSLPLSLELSISVKTLRHPTNKTSRL
ncbi:hypothetical protein ACB092_12G115900 [Castanea dentata]